jgi:hypothetical protein
LLKGFVQQMNSSTRMRRSTRFIRPLLLPISAFFLMPMACEQLPKVDNTGPSCGGSRDCAAGMFCNDQGECETECTTCGNQCTKIEECPSGQFCDPNGTCQKECELGVSDSCSDGRKCNENGQCVAKDIVDVPMGGAGGDGGDGDGPECIETEVEFEPIIPNVVLLIDQSRSMTDESGFTVPGDYVGWDCPVAEQDWRWNVVRNVLLNPDVGVVKPLEDKVRFGMALYSSIYGEHSGGSCPQLTEVDIAFGTHQQMVDNFNCSDLVQDTPTRESLTATAEKLAAADLEGPKVIVLATDGEPDTCACPNWDNGGGGYQYPECNAGNSDNDVEIDGMTYSTSQAEQVKVIKEAERIYNELGIVIEVINVSNPNNAALKTHLDQVAQRGGAVSGASIDGFSPQNLADAFQTIIDGVRSCVIDLDGEITEGKEDTGTVRLDVDPSDAVDFQEIGYNDPDGWVVRSPSQIELVGGACETIKSGQHELDIKFPCDAFVPEVR